MNFGNENFPDEEEYSDGESFPKAEAYTEGEGFPGAGQYTGNEEFPEMFFFDVDDEAEEAEFIRLDELLEKEGEIPRPLSGLVSFTFFPQKQGTYIDARFSRLLRRTLILSATGMGLTLEKIRVRPLFVQWQTVISENDAPEKIAREIRADLETQTKAVLSLDESDHFWSADCFAAPADAKINDDEMIRLMKKILWGS
jgi:hypothetical protein